MPKLSERMKLILTLLRVYGPQPVGNIAMIVFPQQRMFLRRQITYMVSTLRKLEAENLIACTEDKGGLMFKVYSVTEKGKAA